jgi:hypothetical protein
VNAKLWVCVIAGVLIAHLSIIFIVDHWRMRGRPMPKAVEPTFSTSTTTYIDGEGRKTNIIHEFTVSTEIADEKTLKELPAPPAAAAAAGTRESENAR